MMNPPSAAKTFPLVAFLVLGMLFGQGQRASALDQMAAFRLGDTILFQGDSITDGNRGRSLDPNHILGHGYQFIIAAKYGALYPERHLTFINRGVSGNKVSDLAARWQGDALDLKPDLLSILVGINDQNANTPPEQFEKTYDKLLAETVAALPHVRLVLCEPFTLPVGSHKENYAPWLATLQIRARIVERLATKYHAPVVHLQKAFDDACRRAPADYWIWDGVHPTYSGHQIVADEWVRTVNQFYGSGFSR
jgi:lysophospholipase L1-like esterase